jgi:exopolysaccharide biosynthesis polyprenyl glycosylphosphotransferase
MIGTGLRPLRGLILRIDALLVILAMGGAYLLHSLLHGLVGFLRDPAPASGFILLGYLAIPIWILLIPTFGLDRFLEERWTWPKTGFRLLQHHLLGFGLLSVVAFFSQLPVNRFVALSFLAFSFFFLLIERVIICSWARRQHERGIGRSRLLLMGEPTQEMQDFVAHCPEMAFPPEVVGYLGRTDSPAPSLSRLGTLDRLPQVLHEQAVDEVVIIDQLSYHQMGWILRVCSDMGIATRISLPRQEAPRVRPIVESDETRDFIAFSQSAPRAAQLPLKQTLDIVLALIGITVLLPVFGALMIMIRICDGSPVLFSQVRVGLHGRRFKMWKFRTMIRGAEAARLELEKHNEVDGPVFKLTEDPRVTRLGGFLRRTSLDELPQLFNVLEGTMSLVGPRPLPELEQQRIHGAMRRRLSMKPGITGLWQVSGRSDVGFAEWMRMDQEYVDRWSFWLDIRLLLATIPAVLRRHGAK